MTGEPGEAGALAAVVARLAAAGAPAGAPAGELWIGDDAAVLAPPPGAQVVACADAVVEGVHFTLDRSSPADVGWKALAVNVSDVAAMGADPWRALASISGPPGTDVDGIAAGLAEGADAFACPVVGGDLTSAPVVVVSVTALGLLEAGAEPVRRDGARSGDVLFVTGPLGASAAGLRADVGGAAGAELEALARHRRPPARVAEGRAARLAGSTAMLDVSDGLALDLARLCEASGVAADLDEVPVAPGATKADALGGGEDHELLFAAPDAERVAASFAEAGLPAPIQIGRVVEARSDGLLLRLAGEPLKPSGWQHRL